MTVCDRGHPGAFREGEVLQQFQDFREKFWSKFWVFLYFLYIFTSPSAQDREVSKLRETFSPKSPSRMTPDVKYVDSNHPVHLHFVVIASLHVDIYMLYQMVL